MPRFSYIVIVAVITGGAVWGAEGTWETVVEGPILIKNRSFPGRAVKEIWAEGAMDAPIQDIQQALMGLDRLPHFMPYLKEARSLGAPLPDSSLRIYTMIDLPIVGKRDYIVRRWLRESVAPDGSGTFRNEWKAEPDYLPRRHGITRVVLNSGGWTVTRDTRSNKSWVVYRFMVDPGSWIPAFAVNLGNEKGVVETYQAVEKEAQRLRLSRVREAAKAKADAGARVAVPAIDSEKVSRSP
jgi:hypothetical protein